MSLRFLRISAGFAISLFSLQYAQAQGTQAASQPSDAAIAGHLAVYKNPFVVNLRKELDGYLALRLGKANTWHGQNKADSSRMEFADLGKVDTDYPSSPFTVYKIENDPFAGGKWVSILFIDKPDRIFSAWMYLTGDGVYELRGFKDSGITSKQIDAMRVAFGKFMLDREHAL